MIWALLGVVLVGVVIFSFFVRRHGEASRPDPGWTPTDEVFKEPVDQPDHAGLGRHGRQAALRAHPEPLSPPSGQRGHARVISGSWHSMHSAPCRRRSPPISPSGARSGPRVCVVVDGRWSSTWSAGWADRHRHRAWQPDTLVDFYSVGKAVVALLVLQLVDAGHLGLDDPIASVWPEFARGGKGAATVRHALCHQAGVPAIRRAA